MRSGGFHLIMNPAFLIIVSSCCHAEELGRVTASYQVLWDFCGSWSAIEQKSLRYGEVNHAGN